MVKKWRKKWRIAVEDYHKECWTQFHENVLARTVLNAGNFLWTAKRVVHLNSDSTSPWTSRWSKG